MQIQQANRFPINYGNCIEKHLNAGYDIPTVCTLFSTEYTVPYTDKKREPRWLMYCNGVGVFPLGSRSAIHAKQKNGKSFLASIFCAVVAGADFGTLHAGLECYPESMTIKANGLYDIQKEMSINRRILYIDTEQEQENCIDLQRRIYAMAGLKERSDRIWVESICNIEFEQRRNYIEERLYTLRPCYVVIDGIADFVNDINSYSDCQNVSTWVANLATKYQCHITMVIHDNWKGAGKDEAEMRGALGTEIRNRVSATYVVSKDDKGVFTVKNDINRNKETGGFSFVLDNNAVPIPYEAPEQASTTKKRDLSAVYEALAKLYSDGELHYRDEILQSIILGLDIGKDMANKYFSTLKTDGTFITAEKRGKYQYYDFAQPF